MVLINTGERRPPSMPLTTLYLAKSSYTKSNSSAIKREDKERIKNRAIEAGIVEPAPMLALHNALVIAKILRFEFPSDEWYICFPSDFEAVLEISC